MGKEVGDRSATQLRGRDQRDGYAFGGKSFNPLVDMLNNNQAEITDRQVSQFPPHALSIAASDFLGVWNQVVTVTLRP